MDKNITERIAEKGIYITSMEFLLNTDINPNDPVSKYDAILQDSCAFFNNVVNQEDHSKNVFSVGINPNYPNKILEPCPVFYTGDLKKPFSVVFVGLNPHREPPYLGIDTTWKFLTDYHSPSGEKIKSDSNYQRIADTLLRYNEYFDPVFRMHQLFNRNQIYNRWSDIKDTDYRNNFLSEIEQYPILNAEMIPYKSETYSLDNKKAKTLESNSCYLNYLKCLFGFIDEHTDNNSWIVIIGNTPKTKALLYAMKDMENAICPSDADEKLSKYLYPVFNELTNKNNNFYCFRWAGHKSGKKVLLSPFIYSKAGEIPISSIHKVLKNAFGSLS